MFNISVQEGELAIIHEVIAAEAPTLVFLHDSLGCIQTWRDFPGLLAQKTSCNYLVYDRLGHGESSPHPQGRRRHQGYLEAEADVLNALLRQLNISNPILFGHSDGASIALIAAAQPSNNIKGILLEAPHIFVEEITLESVHQAREAYPGGLLKQLLAKYHGVNTDDVFYAWANTWLSEEFRHWNIEHLLPQIDTPCLVLQGEEDQYGTMRQVDGIANQVTGRVQVEVLEGVGHAPHKENSDLIMAFSTAFVDTIRSH